MNGLRLFPDGASSISGEVDALFVFLLSIAAFFSVLICVFIVAFALRYRRRPGDQPPTPVPTNMKLEIVWSAIPCLLTIVMFVWGARLYLRAFQPPADAMEISVEGKQWMWKVQHPEGRREIDELHVPLGRPIKLNMISQDVIHDFSIPAFRIKHDVLPGRYTSMWFEPTRTGTYHLFCSQYCGANHASMVGWVYVMEPADYQAWLAGVSADEAPAVVGQRLFAQYACMTCHGERAPTLANLYGSTVRLQDGSTIIADDNYLRESIVNPRARIVAGFAPIMPTYKGQLSEEQISDLIAYIKSLGNQPGATTQSAADAFVTHSPRPDTNAVLPTSGPAAPGANPLPPQSDGIRFDTRPATQP